MCVGNQILLVLFFAVDHLAEKEVYLFPHFSWGGEGRLLGFVACCAQGFVRKNLEYDHFPFYKLALFLLIDFFA